jgi:ABC-type amino acid transport substrate-binding protein
VVDLPSRSANSWRILAEVGPGGRSRGQRDVALSRNHKVAYSTYASVRDGLDAVKIGRIDAFVPIARYSLGGSSLEVLETAFDKQNYAIALPNGSPLRAEIYLVLVESLHDPRLSPSVRP